jgi:hypothetical protein
MTDGFPSYPEHTDVDDPSESTLRPVTSILTVTRLVMARLHHPARTFTTPQHPRASFRVSGCRELDIGITSNFIVVITNFIFIAAERGQA